MKKGIIIVCLKYMFYVYNTYFDIKMAAGLSAESKINIKV